MEDRYLTDGEGNSRHPLGLQLPTRFLTSSISAGVPGGIYVDPARPVRRLVPHPA